MDPFDLPCDKSLQGLLYERYVRDPFDLPCDKSLQGLLYETM